MAVELLTEKISFTDVGNITITPSRISFLDNDVILTCKKISFPLYVAYKITAITIKCGTAITDKLKLRRIK
ncbi:MAG TPA: hypothetical protein VMV86_00570 [Methanosarcinales archaeon]|nr:hypothetical protein [Methanosarcinales archaeon]